MIEQWRVLAYDINSNDLITEFPYKGLQFDSRLGQAGSLAFSAFLHSEKAFNLVAPVFAYQGNPVAAYVTRNGIIVWGGLLWTQNPTFSTGEVAFGGADWLSWGEQRVQVADYSADTYPNGIDPAQLIYQAFTDAQNPALAGPGASVGLSIVAPASPISVVPGYPLSQYVQLSRIISDMANVVQPGYGGVEVTTSSAFDPTYGIPVNTLNVWTPRAGRAAGQSGVTIDLAQAIDWTWPVDATQGGNTLIVTGSSGTSTPIAIVNTPGVSVGAPGEPPRLDLVKSYTSVNTQQQISLMANGVALQYGFPLATPTITVPTATYLGTFTVGDDARIYSEPNWRFPDGLDQFWRIVQAQVTVPDDGGSATIQLTLNTPPQF